MRKLKCGVLLGIFLAMGSMTTISYAGNVSGNTDEVATTSDAGGTEQIGELEISTMEGRYSFVSNEEELRAAVVEGATIELNSDILLTETLYLGSAKIIGNNHKFYTNLDSGIYTLINGGELKDLTIETNHELYAIEDASKIENVKLISKIEEENTGIKIRYEGKSTILDTTIEGYKIGIDMYIAYEYPDNNTNIKNVTINRGGYNKEYSEGIRQNTSLGNVHVTNANISGYDVAVRDVEDITGGIFTNNNIALKDAIFIEGAEIKNNKIGIDGWRTPVYIKDVKVMDNEIGIKGYGYLYPGSTGLVTNNEIGVISFSSLFLSNNGLYVKSNKRYNLYSDLDIYLYTDDQVKYSLRWKEFAKDGTSLDKKAIVTVDKGDEFTITEESNEFSRLKSVKVDGMILPKEKIETTKVGDKYIHKITIIANANKEVELEYVYNNLKGNDNTNTTNANLGAGNNGGTSAGTSSGGGGSRGGSGGGGSRGGSGGGGSRGGSGGGGSRGGSGGGDSRGGSGGGSSRGGSGGGGSRGAGAGAGIAKTGLPQTQATLPTIASTLPSINIGKWEKVNQKWSLKKADGQYARNQWANIASKWYFLDKDGYILTGLNNINNNTYNFAADGSMSLGWVNINYKWYYFEPGSGAMKKGWLLYNNNWYYLKADGTMAVNEKTADGYQVNNLGIWVR